jgi:hypothetical protein
MKNLILILCLSIAIAAHTQVAINTDGTNPDNSAMLDVNSTDKGLLLPRMTHSQRNAIASPANGLVIYQTDNTPGFYYNSGTSGSPAWQIVGTGSGWGLTGNSGTSAGTNFLGTIDNVPLVFKVNNELAGKIDPATGNTSLGYQTLNSNSSGSDNTASGYKSLYFNTSGISNTAGGSQALYYNTTGNSNTANGSKSLFNNIYGSDNVANGYSALFSNTYGNYNTAGGSQALFNNISGSNNTANGMQALYSNTTGYINTANGSSALFSNTTGIANTAIGYNALNHNTTGGLNTASGSEARV